MSSQKSLHFPVLRSHSWFVCGSVIIGTCFTRELRKKKNKKKYVRLGVLFIHVSWWEYKVSESSAFSHDSFNNECLSNSRCNFHFQRSLNPVVVGMALSVSRLLLFFIPHILFFQASTFSNTYCQFLRSVTWMLFPVPGVCVCVCSPEKHLCRDLNANLWNRKISSKLRGNQTAYFYFLDDHSRTGVLCMWWHLSTGDNLKALSTNFIFWKKALWGLY